MRLQDFIQAPTRVSWTLRLLVYVAVVVTAVICVQVIHVFFV